MSSSTSNQFHETSAACHRLTLHYISNDALQHDMGREQLRSVQTILEDGMNFLRFLGWILLVIIDFAIVTVGCLT